MKIWKIWEFSVFSVQSYYKPKTTPKNIVFFFFLNQSKLIQEYVGVGKIGKKREGEREKQ